MRLINSFIFFSIVAINFASCKKSTDSVDLNEQLAGTFWAGEFKYISQGYTGLQPFSIELKSDGTLSWSDLGSTRPGGTWVTTGSKIKITFSSLTSVTADISNDVWSNFSNTKGDGFQIDNLVRSARPEQMVLSNTLWVGEYFANPLKVRFLPPATIELSKSGLVIFSGTYSIEGAGIRFKNSSPVSMDNYYGVLLNNASAIKGFASIGTSFYPTWNAKKQ